MRKGHNVRRSVQLITASIVNRYFVSEGYFLTGAGGHILSLEDDHSLIVCRTWTGEIIGSGGTYGPTHQHLYSLYNDHVLCLD